MSYPFLIFSNSYVTVILSNAISSEIRTSLKVFKAVANDSFGIDVLLCPTIHCTSVRF